MPSVTISVLQELIRRGVIKNALAGRDEKWVRILLTFLKKHIGDPNFAATAIDVISMLIGECNFYKKISIKQFTK